MQPLKVNPDVVLALVWNTTPNVNQLYAHNGGLDSGNDSFLILCLQALQDHFTSGSNQHFRWVLAIGVLC